MNSIYKSEGGDETSYWNWNGFKIFWSVKGKENSHPMILIHGFGASSKHWRKILTTLQKKGILFTR